VQGSLVRALGGAVAAPAGATYSQGLCNASSRIGRLTAFGGRVLHVDMSATTVVTIPTK
jgi:hypothetical protein